jgi:hypothetical protein
MSTAPDVPCSQCNTPVPAQMTDPEYCDTLCFDCLDASLRRKAGTCTSCGCKRYPNCGVYVQPGDDGDVFIPCEACTESYYEPTEDGCENDEDSWCEEHDKQSCPPMYKAILRHKK